MASQERWVAAAAEILDMPVSDAVLLARRKDGAGVYLAAGAVVFVVVFAVVVYLTQIEVIPGSSLLIFFAAALPISLLFVLGTEWVFAALTPAGIEMTSSTRWRHRPVGPRRGQLDPTVVLGPAGPLRNLWEIAGTGHQTSLRQGRRFQKMLAAASVGESTT